MASKVKPDPLHTAMINDFRKIPGVGKSIAQDFLDLGFTSSLQLRGQDPEQLYLDFCKLKGMHIDRCMLYVFRCAVYFVSTPVHEAEKLNW
jgi:Pathogenicity locus